jgi:Domain of unknown function (DUF1998)
MKNVLRLSQLVGTFGPGAMVDLPNRSVIIGGLDRWDVAAAKPLNEPRLQRLIERSLRDPGNGAPRLGADQSITLRTPPLEEDTGSRHQEPPGIDALIFPTMFVCDRIEGDPAKNVRRRRLVPWQALDERSDRRKYRMPDDKLETVSPIRLVGACEHGHIEDLNWRGLLHGKEECKRTLFIEEKGTSGAPGDTAIVCECGKRLTLQEAQIPGRLGKCRGHRPWLGHDMREACSNDMRLLTRTATHTYFPQVATVISLPLGDEEMARRIDDIWADVQDVKSLDELTIVARVAKNITAALQGLDLGACYAHIRSRLSNEVNESIPSPRIAEFDLLASGAPLIGSADRHARLYAQTLSREGWDAARRADMRFIRSVVAVHRLKEVSCLFGFTRFEPAPTTEDDVEDLRLPVAGAPLAETLTWLPAIEQFGEGIFLHIEPDVIEQWLAGRAVRDRAGKLAEGHRRWVGDNAARAKQGFPGAPYVLLHSLSHALMIEIALESGYPASSIKERIYALRDTQAGEAIRKLGILIYTASTGAQGTLGGLVGSAPRITTIIENALARIGICSNDPICADHDPANSNDDRSLHGAACHGCLLVAETSCEKRNEFLDRALLVETMATRDVALFDSR